MARRCPVQPARTRCLGRSGPALKAARLGARRMVRSTHGRTELSQHRRRAAGKRRPRRSVRAFLLTTVVSAILVAAGAKYVIGQFAIQANPLAEALTAIPASQQGAALEHQRQHMILMVAATK